MERVQQPGVERVALDERGQHLALGVHHHPSLLAEHDEVRGDGLQTGGLGPHAVGDDEVGRVAAQRSGAVPVTGGRLDGVHEVPDQAGGHVLQCGEVGPGPGVLQRDPPAVEHVAQSVPDLLGVQVGGVPPVGQVGDVRLHVGRAQCPWVHPSGGDRVLDVVHAVGDVVRPVHHLGLQAPTSWLPGRGALPDPLEDRRVVGVHPELGGPGAVAVPGVLQHRVEAGPGEVETGRAPVRVGPLGLQPGQHPQRLRVALEAPDVRGKLVQDLLPVVPEGRVADVVGQAGGVDHVASQPRAAPNSRPIWATSREWVSRLRTKSSLVGWTTCVVAASRRRAAEWTTRARSRAKSCRSARFWAGSSATQRSRSASV
ncbi:hypothetical protein BJF81_03325 [Ornithinimicrobium sp. CNJ-824]|nr:hypothetical protein BJF81_03325 [Ornithinimicrobium sp. CNJ-824]